MENNSSNQNEELVPSEEAQEQQLGQLKQELDEYKDKYLRLLADTENTRKRMIKERQETTKHAVADVIAEFLQPLDHLESALGYSEKASDEIKNWIKGFEMILNQFKGVLQNHGVSSYISVGMHYDPHFHEAVEVEETEQHPHGTILAEYTKGYKMGDRTLRPARVKVSKTPAAPPKPDEAEQSEDSNSDQ